MSRGLYAYIEEIYLDIDTKNEQILKMVLPELENPKNRTHRGLVDWFRKFLRYIAGCGNYVGCGQLTTETGGS